MHLWIDHLVVGCDDLALGVDAVTEMLGTRPVYGGAHEGLGTHNALVSLGAQTYLEVIAPDPDQPRPPGPLAFGLDAAVGGGAPRLVAFAVGTDDLDGLVGAVRAAGVSATDPAGFSRRRPDGVLLEWRLAFFDGEGTADVGDATPFAIAWGDTPSPATSAPFAGQLVSLDVRHYEPGPTRELLRVLLGEGLPNLDVSGVGEATLAAIVRVNDQLVTFDSAPA